MTVTDAVTESGVHPAADDPEALLTVDNLKVHFPIKRGILFKRQVGAVYAVDGVSFSVRPGETLGLVGESGCGKTTTGRAVTKLIDPTSGSVKFQGQEIANLSRRNMQ